MSSRPRYVPGPDGLPARDVGPWVRDKVYYVDRYADIFATGMKNRWPRRAYVELFAGPGLSWDRSDRTFIEGSAVRAMARNFTDYAYVDLDPTARDALVERVRAHHREGTVANILPAMDCNDAIDEVRRLIPENALTLAFVDPTTWQVRFEAVERLVAGRRVDLLMTFHTGTMQRLTSPKAVVPALDAFFGTRAWRQCFDLELPRWEVPAALIRLYNEQLVRLGYHPDCHLYTRRISNTKRRHMYQLVVFTRSERGIDFWRKAIAKSPQPDLGLWG